MKWEVEDKDILYSESDLSVRTLPTVSAAADDVTPHYVKGQSNRSKDLDGAWRPSSRQHGALRAVVDGRMMQQRSATDAVRSECQESLSDLKPSHLR